MFVIIEKQTSVFSFLCFAFQSTRSVIRSSGCSKAPQSAITRITWCCLHAVNYQTFTLFLLIGGTLHHLLMSHWAPKSFKISMEEMTLQASCVFICSGLVCKIKHQHQCSRLTSPGICCGSSKPRFPRLLSTTSDGVGEFSRLKRIDSGASCRHPQWQSDSELWWVLFFDFGWTRLAICRWSWREKTYPE